ncbi:shikimate dehydrogenase [Pararhodobacter sp. CCB-MM2]|uniref:shikimate dehydrogenase family protein n=1 Tax=Pararhodobacter sp. CCB-MM2 TaxID=1786003 RepID=UPI0008329FF1|nr:hypothetical protein [Pararhodobacter sp. CCB-MM2]
MSLPDGATHVHFLMGHPTTQAKSPSAMTALFAKLGLGDMVLPLSVPPGDFGRLAKALWPVENLGGLIVTVPHKIEAQDIAQEMSEAARRCGAVNVLRRLPGGGWYGDNFDGEAMVLALRGAGFDPAGARVLLIGAGGVGKPIALSLAEAGIAALTIRDIHPGRAEALRQGIATHHPSLPEAEGFDLVLNATPMGLDPADPLPAPEAEFLAAACVADVTTPKGESPMIARARRAGLVCVDGHAMYQAQLRRILDFVRDAPGPAGR